MKHEIEPTLKQVAREAIEKLIARVEKFEAALQEIADGCDDHHFSGKVAREALATPSHPQREGQQGQWMPIESAPLGSFLAWIPSTNMAWPAWKENNGRIFSNAHGPLNELDYGDGRFIEATHWHEKLPPPEPRT